MLVEKSFDTGEVVLNYAEGPDNGPPLVLLHGWTDRWQDFLPIIPTLILRWKIYAPDFRGHGKSGRVQGKYRPEDIVKDTAIFLHNIVDDRVFLLGHSAGGVAALMIGAMLPEKVKAIIVGDSPIDLDSHITQMNEEAMIDYWSDSRSLCGRPMDELTNMLHDRNYDSSRIRYVAKTLSQVDPGVLDFHAEGRTQDFFSNVDMEAVLRQISCPILLLQGDPSKGGVMTDQEIEYVKSLNPSTSNVLIQNEGHSIGLYSWNVSPLLRGINYFLESFR